MRHFREVLQSGRKWIVLFALTVLLPGLFLALLAIRGFRGEESWRQYQKKERQQQIARLLESDLNDWLSSLRRQRHSEPLFRLEMRGEELWFPALNVVISSSGLARSLPALSSEQIGLWNEAQKSEWLRDSSSGSAPQEVYLRLIKSQPDLAPLARLALLRLSLANKQHRIAWKWLTEIQVKDAAAVTESGVPVWVAAALLVSSGSCPWLDANSSGRTDFVKAVLTELNRGRWQLTAAQWVVYAAEMAAFENCRLKSLDPQADPLKNHIRKTRELAGQIEALISLHATIVGLRETLKTEVSPTPQKRFLPELKSFIVLFPGPEPIKGLLMEAQDLKDKAQARLEQLTVAEDFNGTISLVGSSNGSTPSQEAFRLTSFPFLQIRFAQKSGSFLDLRKHFSLYATILLLLVAVLGLLFTYRAVSHEVAVSRLKADFVAAVSHEFRSPLTSILALLERLEGGRVRDDETLRRYHHVIHQEVQRLHLMVNSLLDFARLEEGRKELNLQPADLGDLAQEVVRSFHNLGHGDRVRLLENGSPVLPVTIDRIAIAQCIHNLIDNAIKYSPKEFPIVVKTGRENGETFLEVSDQGPGIPVSEQLKIFEQFYRARAADVLSVKGAGLGLALVKQIMEKHGGRVTVECREGEGSKFRLTFLT